MAAKAPVSPERRKKVLKVLFISLLLDLVCLDSAIPCFSPCPWLTLQSQDILHLHPTLVPQTPRVLPQCRNTRIPDPPLADLLWPQCVQEQLQQTHQRSLRHCPPRRRTRLHLLHLPGSSVACDRNSFRPIWPAHSLAVVDGGQHCFGSFVVRRNRLPDLLGQSHSRRTQRGKCTTGNGYCYGYQQ